MAFQFVPNADGSFDEGMRQTNTETGVEYIFTDGAWRPLGPKIEDQFDDLDERYVQKAGDTMEGALRVEALIAIDKPDKSQQFKLTPNTSDYFTTIYAYNADSNNGGLRFRVAPGDIKDGYKTFLQATFKDNVVGGTTHPVHTELNWLRTPTSPHHAANKQYVDDKVSGSGGVPVGSIMMWINSLAPDGWFKLKGGTFDVAQYPLLHAYLQNSPGSGYTSGKLPDWRGHYPGQLGDHLNGDVGIKLPQRTAAPSGGYPHSGSNFNNGENKTANKAGSTDFAGIRKGQVSINEGWDDVTRPKTVAVHFIIKHD